MQTSQQKLGSAGEDMATTYLKKKGYRIICRNFKAGKNEIDMICLEKKELVIVEVKTARSSGFGQPEARISPVKQRSIIKATYLFLSKNRQYQGKNIRFDVICISLNNYPAGINHYKGAFWEERF